MTHRALQKYIYFKIFLKSILLHSTLWRTTIHKTYALINFNNHYLTYVVHYFLTNSLNLWNKTIWTNSWFTIHCQEYGPEIDLQFFTVKLVGQSFGRVSQSSQFVSQVSQPSPLVSRSVKFISYSNSQVG